MPTPLDDLKSRLSMLKSEALRMQQSLASSPNAGTPFWDALADEAGATVGGAITSGLFGLSRVGSKTGRAFVRQQRVVQRRQLESAQRAQALIVVAQVRAELEGSRDHIATRFRQSLMNTLSQAANAKRPDTILRRSTEVMDRMLVYEPRLPSPEHPAGPSGDYLRLKGLEEALRNHIVSRLSALTPNWWTERVPDDVRQTAERRKATREATWPWCADPNLRPVHYMDFADYAKVICRKDNWRDTFQRTFGDAELVRAKLRELEPIRNDVAHSRELNRPAKDKLRLYSQDFLQSMKG